MENKKKLTDIIACSICGKTGDPCDCDRKINKIRPLRDKIEDLLEEELEEYLCDIEIINLANRIVRSIHQENCDHKNSCDDGCRHFDPNRLSSCECTKHKCKYDKS